MRRKEMQEEGSEKVKLSRGREKKRRPRRKVVRRLLSL